VVGWTHTAVGCLPALAVGPGQCACCLPYLVFTLHHPPCTHACLIHIQATLVHKPPTYLFMQICDFGYSKHEKYQSAPGSRVGTPAYLAPEVIMTTKGKTYDGKVGRASWRWERAVYWRRSWGIRGRWQQAGK